MLILERARAPELHAGALFHVLKQLRQGMVKVHDSEEEMLFYASYYSNDHRGDCSHWGHYQIRVLMQSDIAHSIQINMSKPIVIRKK